MNTESEEQRGSIIRVVASWAKVWICLFNRGADEEGKIFQELQYADSLRSEAAKILRKNQVMLITLILPIPSTYHRS